MAFTGSIEDRLAIRELYGAFAVASSTGNRDEWLGFWTDDCRWKTNLFELEGKAAVRQQWDTLWVNFEKVALLSELGATEIDGDQAKVKIIVREVIALKGGGVYKLAGCYSDTLVKRNGQWLIHTRDYDTLVEEPPV